MLSVFECSLVVVHTCLARHMLLLVDTHWLSCRLVRRIAIALAPSCVALVSFSHFFDLADARAKGLGGCENLARNGRNPESRVAWARDEGGWRGHSPAQHVKIPR